MATTQTTITLSNIQEFKQKALRWAARFNHFILFDSNSYPNDKYSKIEWKLAVDAMDFIQPTDEFFVALEKFQSKYTEQFICGFCRYDALHDEINRGVENFDDIGFPALYFFQPRYVLELNGHKLTVNRNYPETFEILEHIQSVSVDEKYEEKTIYFTEQTKKQQYIEKVERIRQAIEEGDYYELNYCTELIATHSSIDPIAVFEKMNVNTKAPFSCFVKYQSSYLLCASPERFMCKRDHKIISQPIKGTIRRGQNTEEDTHLVNELFESEKERAENVMIVDLVRNDLTPFAEIGSICVEELFGVYTFNTVHQMISTISAKLLKESDAVKAIHCAFPMGSMTGAPKQQVRQQIAAIEDFNRGLFSGTVGYFDDRNDFDLNVVIRSVLYNASSERIAIRTGGAITYDSVPEQEYNELLLKREAMLACLNGEIIA